MRRAFAVAVLLASTSALAEPVAVRVVDVAGGAVYVTPGRAAGIVPGTRIRLRGVEAAVVEVTEKTAVVRLDPVRVAIGDTGTADVTPGAVSAVRTLDKPRPADVFAGQWNEPVLPASRQSPQAVSLGAMRPSSRGHVTVIGHAFGAVDRVRSTGDAEARVIAAFDVMTDRPLAAELDVAARWFADGADRHTRTPVFVRAAELRYGDPRDPRAILGRLPFAATAVGMLDGGRASARVGSVEVAAFGGLVPDPLSGKPDTSAARFGAELAYDAPDAPWRPRVAMAAHGSTWNGQLDERRLSIAASGDRGALWLDGWADLDAFPSSNPWRAGAVELAGAGATAAWRSHAQHAAIDVTFLRPERSLRLAAALPPEWLCTLASDAAGPEHCAGGDSWTAATASLGTRTPRWALDVIGTLGDSRGQYRGLDRSGYLRGELRAGPARLIAGLSAGAARFASWTAGELGVAYVSHRALDISVAYRPELLDYVASTQAQLVHALIADARVTVSAALDLALSAVGTGGTAAGDRDTLALLATFVWRPAP